MTTETILEALRERDLLDLLDSVCRPNGVTREEVCGRRRTRRIARARRELWLRLRRELRMSYGEIAELFGRNHSTVLTGVRSLERGQVDSDEEVAAPEPAESGLSSLPA